MGNLDDIYAADDDDDMFANVQGEEEVVEAKVEEVVKAKVEFVEAEAKVEVLGNQHFLDEQIEIKKKQNQEMTKQEKVNLDDIYAADDDDDMFANVQGDDEEEVEEHAEVAEEVVEENDDDFYENKKKNRLAK